MRMAVLVVSDTRDLATDKSGLYLATALQQAGHELHERVIVHDSAEVIQKQVRYWQEHATVDVVLISGGTGVTGRDVTPEALAPLWTKELPGFGELFRWLSFADIGASTIQSRACGGLVGRMLVFCLPGSEGACRLAWEKILQPQCDVTTKPCNFAMLMPRFEEGSA